MKPITPASYQKVFQITPGTSNINPQRALLLTIFNASNSIGLKFYDNTGVTLANVGASGTNEILPLTVSQVISATGLTAYGMI